MNKLKIFNSFDLKIIAFIAMLVDHIGYFFYYLFDSSTYYTLRGIGRIAMPIFAFLIYQGFKHTSNLKAYFKRLIAFASITQIIVLIMGIIAWKLKPGYSLRFYLDLNIVFSFALGIVFLYVINSFRNIKNKGIIDYICVVLTIISLIGLYTILPLDYGILTLILLLVFYILDKLKENNRVVSMYVICILAMVVYLFVAVDVKKFTVLAVPILTLYNGQKGTTIKRLFYYAYPLQFVILFGLGMLLYR